MASKILNIAELKDHISKHPLPSGFIPSYGTAGFRAEGSLLVSTMHRCGILAAMRSIKLAQTTGAMITASHNKGSDNGIKLVEPDGLMLVQEWELYATRLAKTNSSEEVIEVLDDIINSEQINVEQQGNVIVGHDTRATASELVAAFSAGVKCVGGQVVQAGLLTTPMLHFKVYKYNKDKTDPMTNSPYFERVCGGFNKLCKDSNKATKLVADCACGVGAVHIGEVSKRIQQHINVEIRNTEDQIEFLNSQCGADYVQKERKLPRGFENVENGARCCSMDGDADRLVYFIKQEGDLQLIDGDRCASLIANILQKVVGTIQRALPGSQIGVVQTAYANGASTKFLQSLGLQVKCVPTGVKHLHHAAEQFDVGVYFEANGHGTVLFKPKLMEQLYQVADSNGTDAQEAAQVCGLYEIMNQQVGDAYSNILAMEALFKTLDMSPEALVSLYTDLPSLTTKVSVKDRNLVKTSNAERTCDAPAGLQAAIDAEVAKVADGRCFVRPSGTEDVVRVYAEAANEAEASQLSQAVMALVQKFVGTP